MSDQPYDASQPIQIKPIVNYPREAQAGQTYLMTIDLQLAVPNAPWPYPDEEYPISFILNMQPYFRYEALSAGHRPGVVLHRFGGTYGPAHYLLTASEQPVAPGRISITFINGWGLPITHMELECEVRKAGQTDESREVTVERREQVAVTPEYTVPPEVEEEAAPDAQPLTTDDEAGKESTEHDLISAQLEQTGWTVDHFWNADLVRDRGMAIFGHPNFSDDYILFVDQQPIGIVKARPVGELLAGVEKIIETEPFAEVMESWLKISFDRTTMRHTIPFAYETTGIETRFTNWLEPEPRSRSVFAFH